MACLEHRCTKCGWVCFDNSLWARKVCPSCGADVTTFYDEVIGEEEEEEEEEEE